MHSRKHSLRDNKRKHSLRHNKRNKSIRKKRYNSRRRRLPIVTVTRRRRRHSGVRVFSKNNDKFDLPDELEVTPIQKIERKNTQENSSGNIIDGMRELFIKKKGFVM